MKIRKKYILVAAVSLILITSQFSWADDSVKSWGPWNTELYTAAGGQHTGFQYNGYGSPEYVPDRAIAATGNSLANNPLSDPVPEPPFELPASPPVEPPTAPPLEPPVRPPLCDT